MTARTRMWVAILVGLAATGSTGLTAVGAGAATGEVIYDNLPEALPGNFASLGFESDSTAEFGGEVEFTGTARKNPKVTIAMSSWACQSGHWYSGDCVTGPGAKFAWPITINVYEVGPEGSVGAKLASGSKVFKMPYRPSASTKCTEGRWSDKGECFNGKAFKIALSLKAAKLPTRAIVSVSYNTSDYGVNPIGKAPCNTSSGGCFYDSLNVAVIEPSEGPPSKGSDPTDAVYVNSTDSEMLCEGGGTTPGTFSPSKCPAFWEGLQPAFEVSATP